MKPIIRYTLLLLSCIRTVHAALPGGMPWACEKNIRHALKSFGSHDEPDWRKTPAPVQSIKRFVAPTPEWGQWFILEVDRNTEFLSVQSSSKRVTYEFSPRDRCEPKITLSTSKNASGAHKDEFGDEHLKAKLAATPNSLIYIWSPHMALSVRGIPQVEKAAAALGLPVLFLVDPVADERSLLKGKGKRAASFEIAMRDGLIHYPSLMVVRAGVICKRVQRGYREAAEYQRIATNIFGKCDE